MFKKAFFLLTLSMFLAACASAPKESSPTIAENVSLERVSDQGQEKSDAQDDSLSAQQTTNKSVEKKTPEVDVITRRLINEGRYALSEQRLLTPEDDNANMYFQIALGRDPGNYEAIIGIAAIVDTYLEWAVAAAERRQYSRADAYVANASFVSPDDPSVAETRERIQQIRKRQQQAPFDMTREKSTIEASEDVFILPKSLFQLSEDEIIAKMQPIIDRVTQTQRAVEINWPSDKEGRLIYQILNSRTPEFRVRAMIYHRARYTVEVN